MGRVMESPLKYEIPIFDGNGPGVISILDSEK